MAAVEDRRRYYRYFYHLFNDIAYLTDKTSDLKAVLQDYKVGKAYEYF